MCISSWSYREWLSTVYAYQLKDLSKHYKTLIDYVERNKLIAKTVPCYFSIRNRGSVL